MSSSVPFQDIPFEKVREFWNERPCNIRHSSKPLGTREYYDEVEARKYLVESHIPRFADFPRWEGKKVLEIGCGIGTDTISFARAGAHVTAVDLTEKSLAVARRRAEVFGVTDRVRFLQANAEKLSDSLPPERYDLIYSFGVLHHTPRPGDVLDQLHHYAGPDTTVKIMVYNRWSWKVLWLLVVHGKFRFWNLDDLIATHSEAQTGCPVTHSYSRAQARQWLARHGFETTEVTVDHIFPYSIPQYVKYEYEKVWYFRMLPTAVFRALERTLGWHLCLTAKPKA